LVVRTTAESNRAFGPKWRINAATPTTKTTIFGVVDASIAHIGVAVGIPLAGLTQSRRKRYTIGGTGLHKAIPAGQNHALGFTLRHHAVRGRGQRKEVPTANITGSTMLGGHVPPIGIDEPLVDGSIAVAVRRPTGFRGRYRPKARPPFGAPAQAGALTRACLVLVLTDLPHTHEVIDGTITIVVDAVADLYSRRGSIAPRPPHIGITYFFTKTATHDLGCCANARATLTRLFGSTPT